MTEYTESGTGTDDGNRSTGVTRRRALRSAGGIGAGAFLIPTTGLGAANENRPDGAGPPDGVEPPVDEDLYSEAVMFGENLDDWEVEIVEEEVSADADTSEGGELITYVGEDRVADPEKVDPDEVSAEWSRCASQCLPSSWPVNCCLSLCGSVTTTGVNVSVTLCNFILWQKGVSWGRNLTVRASYYGIRVTITVSVGLDGNWGVCARACWLNRSWCLPTFCI